MLRLPQKLRPWIGVAVVVALIGGVLAARSWWLPQIKARILAWAGDGAVKNSGEGGHEDHAGHEGHDGGDDSNTIAVTAQGLKNIGFWPMKVALGPYAQTVRMPAMIVERPGKTQIQVPAPMTGIVTKVLAQEGVAVDAGDVLFEMRLIHEELVTAQRGFLKTAESLDVVNREIKRLKGLTEGLVPGKRLLDEEYERQKLEASLKAERQGLILHGITEPQVEDILKTRKLLQTIVVRAPQQSHEGHHHDEQSAKTDHPFHVQQLNVQQGQQIEAGSPLCILADHYELFVEGRAFEDGADQLKRALDQGWEVNAYLASGQESGRVGPLHLLFLSDRVDPESRAFRFYLTLPNEVTADRTGKDGKRYVAWRYRPGQRLEVEVPISTWEKRIVLPVDALVDEGAESYVFRQNGAMFERVAVHVEHRDRTNVVLANDGSLFPGDVVAAKGAYQLQLAIKNKAGGGADPHAGHHH
jgi:multidrug efflux pump subunit AcrA (membrane-fusion protein)